MSGALGLELIVSAGTFTNAPFFGGSIPRPYFCKYGKKCRPLFELIFPGGSLIDGLVSSV